MAKLFGGILSLLKESVQLHHTLTNVFKQFNSHSKAAPKNTFWVKWDHP
jgi:hypothetical protein